MVGGNGRLSMILSCKRKEGTEKIFLPASREEGNITRKSPLCSSFGNTRQLAHGDHCREETQQHTRVNSSEPWQRLCSPLDAALAPTHKEMKRHLAEPALFFPLRPRLFKEKKIYCRFIQASFPLLLYSQLSIALEIIKISFSLQREMKENSLSSLLFYYYRHYDVHLAGDMRLASSL